MENFFAIVVLIIRIAIVGSLYGFLAFAIWVLWQGLKAGTKTDRDILKPVEFLGLFNQENKRIQLLTEQQITIGRDPNCNLHIDDNSVSAKHARLSYQHQQWWLQDLDSKNGTYLNHDILSEAVALTSGDIISVGQTNFEVILRSNEDELRIPVDKFND